ncbi:type 1 fimbrial protein [Moellerella wisconsensis]|uniref:fimbrial protein n=1 Tax=Moellerella wisconsensis TaxID=158849 RepID=UPI00240FA94A|nr:type 1 fimbrial protein [Moellerella wisconsensis]WJW82453.1 type 1 fimbrial protein [Moellerella wisconsensis]
MIFKKLALVTLLAGVSSVSLNVMAAPSAEVTLQGILTSSSCDVTINGGKPVLNVGVLNTSVGESDSNFPDVNVMSDKSNEMPVTLIGCQKGENGSLLIQGITSVGNNERNIFVSDDSQTVGFMIKDAAGTTVTNGGKIGFKIGADNTEAQYSFKVGMATTTSNPNAGSYSAPILVAYIVN